MNRRAADSGPWMHTYFDDAKTRVSESWRAELAKEAGTICAELQEIQILRRELRKMTRDRDRWQRLYFERVQNSDVKADAR